MEETWKDIIGYDGYEISNMGRFRSKDRVIIRRDGRSMTFKGVTKTTNVNPNGYIQVTLSVSHKTHNKYIHRLVAEHFLERNNHDYIVNHKDGDKLNNKVDNLEWVSYSENSIHSYREPKQKKPVSSGFPTKICAINIFTDEVKIFKSIRETERVLSISRTQICRILDTNKNTIDGWKFSKNNVEDIERVG